MINFTFIQHVKVVTGKGCFANIGQLLNECCYKKAFIVTTKGMVKRGTIAKLENLLTSANISYIIYDEVLPDPSSDIIDNGAAICKENGCDCVLAIGGGSCIDAAKGINILRFNNGSILDYTQKPIEPCKNLIVIPTTSGTGSELSNGAIVSDSKNHVKLPIGCVDCMPEYAVLDPELTVSMPKKVSVDTGLDAFSHAFEAYTSILSNPMTDIVCEAVMDTVVRNLPKVCENPNDIDAREKMQMSAAIAGWMLYNCAAHVGHSYAHVIGAYFNIAHGQACAYGVPAVLNLISETVPSKIKRIGEILGVKFDENDSTQNITDKTITAYKDFVSNLGLNPVLDKTLTDTDIQKISDMIANEAFAGLSPVKITSEIAKNLLNNTLK